jgi:hypothetical protein
MCGPRIYGALLRTIKIPSLVVPVLLSAVLALTAQPVAAQIKPFKVTGRGVTEFVPIVPGTSASHWAVGHATGMGKYSGEGRVRLDAYTGLTTAAFSSEVPFVFTAANGDQLAFHYGHTELGAAGPGEVTLYPAGNGKVISVWVAEFNPVVEECTGQFANVVDGSFIMVASTEPFVFGSQRPVAYTWLGNGWIEYGE